MPYDNFDTLNVCLNSLENPKSICTYNLRKWATDHFQELVENYELWRIA